jgi:hypothetical protein
MENSFIVKTKVTITETRKVSVLQKLDYIAAQADYSNDGCENGTGFSLLNT